MNSLKAYINYVAHKVKNKVKNVFSLNNGFR